MNDNIVCIDIGYGYTKVAIRYPDGHEQTATISSVYGPVGRELFNGHDRHRLSVWDKVYYYGDDAMKYCRAPVSSRDRHRPKEMIETLFLAACSEAGLFEGRCQVYTALPVDYMADADGLRTFLSGKHHARRVDLNRRIDIHVISDGQDNDPISRSGVQVYPQPMLAFLARAEHRRDLWEDWRTVLVIDVGTGTFNECLVLGGEWIDERAASVPEGMGTVLEQSLQEQERLTGRRDLLTVARSKLWKREPAFMDFCTPYIETLVDAILQTAADVASNLSLTEIILTGGGAPYVVSDVRERFSVPVYMSENPVTDNVTGLMIAATSR